jgi:adenosylhomocysteine nucleosidase
MKAQVLIITAIEPEYKAVRNHLVNLKTAVHPDSKTRYEIGVGPNSVSVAIAEIGAGNANAGIEAERAISFWKPEYAFFVGVAGGIKDVQLGDVVAATTVYGYESGKANDEFRLRPDFGASSYELVQLAMDVRRSDHWLNRIHPFIPPAPKCFVGKIAAGEKVVASTKSDTYHLITKHFSDALAVEMEGIGFLKAAFQNQMYATVIRGISDLIDGKAHADSKGYQEIASRNAAAFAFEMISLLYSELHKETINTEFDWKKLEELAVTLYPKGPEDRSIWERAGGDISILTNEDNRKQMWRSALRELRKGGGSVITKLSLISEILKDYPNNNELSALKLTISQ